MEHDTPEELVPGEVVDATRLARRGLLRTGERCSVSPLAVFAPADAEGTIRTM